MRKFIKILAVITAILAVSSATAVTKPDSNADITKLSYVFYLYYDNGQLFADRDYDIKFDILSEEFVPETVDEATAYTGQILNLKMEPEVVKTFKFDPRKGNPAFFKGKVAVRGPYVSDGLKVQFLDNKGNQLISIFVNTGSICNDDGSCNAGAGENDKTCSNDCKKPRSTPIPTTPEQSSNLIGGLDLNTIIIYAVAVIIIIVLAWFGWRWWKKRKESSFLPPSNPPSPPAGTIDGGGTHSLFQPPTP